MPHSDAAFQELCQVFASLKDAKEAEQFLQDILTPTELEAITERWQLVRQLIEGVPQRQIADNLGVAIATITRGSRQLQYGRGGFKMMYERVKKK